MFFLLLYINEPREQAHDGSLNNKLRAKGNNLALGLPVLSFYKDNYFPIKNKYIQDVF